MKVVYKRTTLEKLQDEIAKAKEQNREISFVTINTVEAAEIHKDLISLMPFDLKGFINNLKREGFYLHGVRVCLLGSEANAKYQATI